MAIGADCRQTNGTTFWQVKQLVDYMDGITAPEHLTSGLIQLEEGGGYMYSKSTKTYTSDNVSVNLADKRYGFKKITMLNGNGRCWNE